MGGLMQRVRHCYVALCCAWLRCSMQAERRFRHRWRHLTLEARATLGRCWPAGGGFEFFYTWLCCPGCLPTCPRAHARGSECLIGPDRSGPHFLPPDGGSRRLARLPMRKANERNRKWTVLPHPQMALCFFHQLRTRSSMVGGCSIFFTFRFRRIEAGAGGAGSSPTG